MEQGCFDWIRELLLGLQVISVETEMFRVNCQDANCPSFEREDEIEVDVQSIVICGDCGAELKNNASEVEA